MTSLNIEISRRSTRYILYVVILALFLLVGYFGLFAIDLFRIALKIRSAGERRDIYYHSQGPKIVATPSGNVTSFCSDKCSVGYCTSQPDLTLFTAASTEIQAFFNLTFQCNGVVKAWKVLDQNPTPGKTVYLDVLKYDTIQDEGTWMGFNKITATGEAGWVTYEIPEAERVRVEPGVFVGIHYGDIAADPVVPVIEDTPQSAGMSLSDGFTILMDHQELARVAKPGRVAEVKMSKLFANLLISIKKNWRAPGIAAIVEPTS